MRHATSADADALAATLARAFAHDPVLGWLIRGARSPARLTRFFGVELQALALPRGEVHTTDDRDGALLILPPGRWRMPLSTQLLHAPAFARAFAGRLAHAFALITLMEHHHPRAPHRYIPYIGVDPKAHGQGVGTRLLADALRESDRLRVPTYLEATADRNVALYERHGFVVTGEIRLSSCPPLRPMWREPSF